MKSYTPFGLCVLLATGAFAQHHGGGAVGGSHGGGSLGAGHRGAPARAQIRNFGLRRSNHYGSGGWGGFYGGYLDPSYDNVFNTPSPAPEGPSSTSGYQPPTPQVIPTVHPVIHEYPEAADSGNSSDPNAPPVFYRIAFKDKSVGSAMTFWVIDSTLYYLDTEHIERQAPLSSVDRGLSVQLNRENHVAFNL